LLLCLLAGEAWALGLGDIRLESALNEPLKAQIELLSATPEDLETLKIGLASADTFERYGIDRPLFVTRLDFRVERRGGGYVVRVTSQQPVTEPFVTILVEANWARGRLLREYTVLLDPPTFAPPPAAAEAVSAPARTAPADRGRIERPAPAPAQRAAPAPRDRGDFATTAGGDLRVQRGDTLWRIAERVRPDDRLTMNQTMMAIYQSNPDAFAGNINVLRAGAELRIPSADEIFRISRGDALNEIRRQNASWSGRAADTRQPSLTLVPPDGEQEDYRGGTAAPDTGESGSAASEARIRQLENRVAEQESLLEVRDDELAQLRSELARLREQRAQDAAAAGEEPPPATAAASSGAEQEEIFVDEEPTPAAEAETAAGAADSDAAEPPAATAEPAVQPAPRVVTQRREEPGLLDKITAALTSIWGLIGAALLIVLGVLVWFARRAAREPHEDDGDSTGVWDALDADDVDSETVASTERLRALARDDDASIVVVEQDEDAHGRAGDTVETPAMSADDEGVAFGDEPWRSADEPVSLEDTFSSETAINLDQSDPMAEADFHMAYGLYDQAADLINGALNVEPDRSDLLAKLCEIYFVWGNRDAFVDAASRLKTSLGGSPSGDWDKTVIMGQQIAGDHELFVGGGGAGATKSVDLAFDESGEQAALDMDFAGGPDGAVSDVIDLGADDDGESSDIFSIGDDDDGLDFSFDADEDTSTSITREMPRGDNDATVESPTVESEAADTTMESPTLEQPAAEYDSDSTSELPAYRDSEPGGRSSAAGSRSSDETAEIDLDDLGLDLDSLGGEFDDDMLSDTEETGTRRALEDADAGAETGRNRELEDTGSRTDVDVSGDDDLRDATGETQILSEDFTVDTGNRRVDGLSDDDATMLAPGPGSDDADFDYAKTEALPKDSFERDAATDETAERPGIAGSTDMDLDLDDLTAALRMSEDDTVDQPRDDATVEQPRPGGKDDLDFDFGLEGSGSDEPTQSLSPDDVSDDLQDARTMTEVGTKLDLARAYVDMGDPGGARNILEEVLDEGDDSQRQQAQQLLDSLPG